MAETKLSTKVDALIGQAPPFAQPILAHLRALVHQACPDCEEAIKWGRPFFLYRGEIVCNISAFKAHCSFGFWGERMGAVLRADGVEPSDSSGSFGRITKLSDLPSDKAILKYVRHAMTFIEEDAAGGKTIRSAKTKPIKPARKTATVVVPPALRAALAKDKPAFTAFEALSPSHRREYVEWIAEAKRDATRETRIARTLAFLAEGKSLHWKYQR